MRHRLAAIAAVVVIATLVFWPSSSVEISSNLNDLESNKSNTLESEIEEVAPSDSSADDNLKKSSEEKKVKDIPIKVDNDSKEKNEVRKVISIEINKFGRDGWSVFTGYNDDNILNTYVVGEDIEAGTYWTGLKNDPCYGSVVTTANGERYMNLEHGEQSVFYLQKGDSLVTKCNWYQGGMPEYKNESPTGMILASQLGIGTFKAKNTGSCILKRDYINNFVNAKTIFLFEEKDPLLIKITQEDIEKNTVIALIDRCGGLVRV